MQYNAMQCGWFGRWFDWVVRLSVTWFGGQMRSWLSVWVVWSLVGWVFGWSVGWVGGWVDESLVSWVGGLVVG